MESETILMSMFGFYDLKMLLVCHTVWVNSYFMPARFYSVTHWSSGKFCLPEVYRSTRWYCALFNVQKITFFFFTLLSLANSVSGKCQIFSQLIFFFFCWKVQILSLTGTVATIFTWSDILCVSEEVSAKSPDLNNHSVSFSSMKLVSCEQTCSLAHVTNNCK